MNDTELPGTLASLIEILDNPYAKAVIVAVVVSLVVSNFIFHCFNNRARNEERRKQKEHEKFLSRGRKHGILSRSPGANGPNYN